MRRFAAALVLLLVGGWAGQLSAQDAGPLSGGSAASLKAEMDPAYAAGLEQALADLLTARPIPRRAVDLVLSEVKRSWLPDDPAQAAAAIFMAAHDCDDAGRRGVPSPQIRSQLRQEWQVVTRDARELTLRRQEQGARALDEFMGSNRRLMGEMRGAGGPGGNQGPGGKP